MNEYRVIKELEKDPCQSQRTLAQRLDISVGKANYLLAGLIEKGLIKASKLKNHPDHIRWKYILTPKGFKEKLRLTRDYLNTRIVEFDKIRAEIEDLKKEVENPAAQ